MNPYRKMIDRDEKGTSDVYDILFAFDVTNPAVAHAIKKLLAAGQRSGGKDRLQDMREAIWSIERAVEIETQPVSAVARYHNFRVQLDQIEEEKKAREIIREARINDPEVYEMYLYDPARDS